MEILRQGGQMVQAALNDQNILAAACEGKLTAITDNTLRRPSILRDQPRRQIHAFDLSETETLESCQTISSSAKKLDNFCIARPSRSAQSIEALDKFSNFPFWRFETQIRGFTGIGRRRTLFGRARDFRQFFHL